MKKWSNRGKRPDIQLQNQSNYKISSNVSPQRKSYQIQNQKNSPQHKSIYETNSKNEKIIHHSIHRNYDPKGNTIIRTKIVKEIDLDNNQEIDTRQKNEFIQYDMNMNMNNRNETDYLNYTKNENDDNHQIMYDENYEIISPRSFNTKFKNTQKFIKIPISERGVGNRDGRISPRGRGGGIINLKTGKISPVMLFNTPESEYDGHKSYYVGRNYQEFLNNNNNTSNISISRRMETTQRCYKNYNLESPYNLSNHSPLNDFGSPDGYNDYYFRNIPIENIKEKKPYQNKKITIRNIQNESSLEYDKNISSMQEKLISIPDGEDELYDMVDYMATLIQSHVRGFLVRKKVLRYITLAIYYQSFCDKIQDVLSSHVKNEIFEILKNIPKNKYKNNTMNKNTPKKTIRKEYSETYLTNKTNKNYYINKLKKDNSYQYNTSTDFNRSFNKYNRYNNLEKSQSPSSRVFHYYIHSPCTKISPHHRYYHEINSKTINAKNYGTETNQLNKTRICNRCNDIGKNKKQNKFYITTTREVNKEEQEEYQKKYEINKEYIVEEKKDIEIDEKKNIEQYNNKYNQLSYNNSFTMRKCIEKDNYLSINIIKLPGNEKMGKSLSSRDLFSKTTKSPNRISKVESINIKTTKRQKTEQEIEEEINRRVKITIIERERAEKERKEKEEYNRKERQRIEIERKVQQDKEKKEKEELKRKERIKLENERKAKQEKERKEREEQIKKAREERYLKDKEARQKKIEQIKIETEKQKKLIEDQSKKTKETKTTELNKDQLEQTTTTKTVNTKKVTYIKSSIDNPNTKININKRQINTSINSDSNTNSNINRNINTNIKTIKKEEEKKINMSDYILKKDCQKNLEMMKEKLEKEYQKKIEYEKNRSIQEQKRYEQIIEIKNKKEIERIIQEQKKKEIEIKKLYEKEKENNKKKEIENQKEREKEMKLNIQRELEKQKELMLKKEIEEKNKKLKLIKINKVFEYNLKSQSQSQNKNKNDNISPSKLINKDKTKSIEKAMKLIKKIILFRGNHLLKLRKYFNDWRLKVKLITLIESANEIKKYCRVMLEKTRIKHVKSNWRKLSNKIYNSSRLKILKMFPKINTRKKKIYELIRITKLTKIFSFRRFLHYIILVWYIYSKNIHRKRINMKFLYENLLKTYMSLAKDIFGNNQIENPSVQDALYEAVNSNKFISLFQDDVPLARQHYEEMQKKRLLFKNRREYSYNNFNYKFETDKKEIKTKYYSKEKIKNDDNNNINFEINNSIDGKRNEEILNKYNHYKSVNRDLILNKKNRFIASIEKDSNNLDNENNNKKFENKKIEINKINFNNTNYENNKSPKGNTYIYQKTEINNTYTKPLGNKYDIKIKDNKDITNNNKRTYIQNHNNNFTQSYSYNKVNQESKSNSDIISSQFRNKENSGGKNNINENRINIKYQSKYINSEGNNKDKNIYKNSFKK